MGIPTKNLNEKVATAVDKKQLKLEMLAFHEATFKKLGVENPIFTPKMEYYSTAVSGLVVSFFESELSSGQDIYVEITDRNHNPLEERKLLFIKHNPHFKEEYVAIEGNVVRYEVLKEELEEIVFEEDEKEIPFYNIPNPDDDPLFSTMTIRDFYAIFHNKPVSRKKFLNDLIQKSK